MTGSTNVPVMTKAAKEASAAMKGQSSKTLNIPSGAATETQNQSSGALDAVPPSPSAQHAAQPRSSARPAPKVEPKPSGRAEPKQKRRRSSRVPKPLTVAEVLTMLVSGKYRDALRTAAALVKREVDLEEQERTRRDKHRSRSKPKAKPKRKRHSSPKKRRTSHSKKHKRH